MISFAEKLLYVMNGQGYTPWAQARDLDPPLIKGWLDGAKPTKKTLGRLEAATGISVDWWLNGDEFPPQLLSEQSGNTYSVETLDTIEGASGADAIVQVDYYPLVSGSAGSGQLVEQSDERVVFKVDMDARLVRERVGSNLSTIKLANVSGDSMYPTLSHGDQVVIDTAIKSFIDDAIYAFIQDEFMRFKRINKRLDGKIIVKSDNPSVGGDPEVYTAEEAQHFHVVGIVVPFKFGRFKV